MSGTFNLIKEFMSALNASEQNKTQPYDTQGTVKRVEGDTAWVQFTGSDRETPVQMTIACDVGDTVQARIGGGSAWLTGNLTAPPTDDKKANQAISMVTTVVQEVQEAVEEALEESSNVEDVTMQYCLSDSSSTFVQYGDWSATPPEYVSGKYYWTRSVIYDEDGNATYGTPQYSQDTQLTIETDIAFNSNNNHFWHDSSGAYVTTADKSYANGSAVRITSSGILQQVNGSTVSSWTNSGISFLQGGSTVASFGSGGVSLYASGTQVASFGSTITLGSTSGKNTQITGDYFAYKDGGTTSAVICGKSGSSGLYISSEGNNMTLYSAGGNIWIGSGSGTTTFSGGITIDGGVTANGEIYSSGQISSNTLKSATTQSKNVNCFITVNGVLTKSDLSSTKRVKHDIKDVCDDILEPKRLYDLPVRQFVYNEGHLVDEDERNGKALVGFIAEEVDAVYPIAADHDDDDMTKAHDWNARFIIPPMLALIQEQNKRIAELEEKLS